MTNLHIHLMRTPCRRDKARPTSPGTRDAASPGDPSPWARPSGSRRRAGIKPVTRQLRERPTRALAALHSDEDVFEPLDLADHRVELVVREADDARPHLG